MVFVHAGSPNYQERSSAVAREKPGTKETVGCIIPLKKFRSWSSPTSGVPVGVTMKECAVLARTVLFLAIGLSVGLLPFPHLTSTEVLGTATGLAGAITANAYISTDGVATRAQSVALNHAGRQAW